MTPVTDREWATVQEALVKGGLRDCINDIITSRLNVQLSNDNRRILEQAYDDGDGHTIDLVTTDEYPWFIGVWGGCELMHGVEHAGRLYCIVHASGGGQVSVLVGRAILDNEFGVAFPNIDEAKAYVKGLTAK